MQFEQLTFTQNWHEWSYALSPDGDRMLMESGRYEGTDVFEMDLEDRSITIAAAPFGTNGRGSGYANVLSDSVELGVRYRLEAICGDGVRQGDEGCDDGNRQSGDGCSSDCLQEADRPPQNSKG